jgi:tRNA threonylcarbamoyladenosine biosynthesis protein TsaB
VILSIETSTEVCSVAIHNNGRLVAAGESIEAYSHAERLAPLINELLADNNIKREELTTVAVSAGPGSYTGLRIGTSTAKGLCYALDIPLITIGTLESMLEGIEQENKDQLLCPMLDARRMEVYCLLADGNGQIIEPTHAKIIDETSFSDYLGSKQISFFGNGADKCKSVINSENAIFIDGIKPSAINIGKLASSKYKVHEFASLVNFEPDYLKAFRAIPAKNPLL